MLSHKPHERIPPPHNSPAYIPSYTTRPSNTPHQLVSLPHTPTAWSSTHPILTCFRESAIQAWPQCRRSGREPRGYTHLPCVWTQVPQGSGVEPWAAVLGVESRLNHIWWSKISAFGIGFMSGAWWISRYIVTADTHYEEYRKMYLSSWRMLNSNEIRLIWSYRLWFQMLFGIHCFYSFQKLWFLSLTGKLPEIFDWLSSIYFYFSRT